MWTKSNDSYTLSIYARTVFVRKKGKARLSPWLVIHFQKKEATKTQIIKNVEISISRALKKQASHGQRDQMQWIRPGPAQLVSPRAFNKVLYKIVSLHFLVWFFSWNWYSLILFVDFKNRIQFLRNPIRMALFGILNHILTI